MTVRFYYAEDSNLTYIRTPKCAGMTMETIFLKLHKYEKVVAYPANITYPNSNSNKFVVVRNPWDRVVSQFECLRTTRKMCKNLKFHDWFYSKDQPFVKRASETYLNISNFYLKFENLEEEVLTKLTPNRKKIRMPHLNSSPREFLNYQDYYIDQRMIDVVAELNKDVIERVGYDF